MPTASFRTILALALGLAMTANVLRYVAMGMANGNGRVTLGFNEMGEGWYELVGFALVAAFLAYETIRQIRSR
jgi:hypothetical protein